MKTFLQLFGEIDHADGADMYRVWDCLACGKMAITTGFFVMPVPRGWRVSSGGTTIASFLSVSCSARCARVVALGVTAEHDRLQVKMPGNRSTSTRWVAAAGARASAEKYEKALASLRRSVARKEKT